MTTSSQVSITLVYVIAWPASLRWLFLISTPFLKLVIPLKSELAVEMLEKGRVRFWLQAEMSANGHTDYVFNDNAISQGEVRIFFFHSLLTWAFESWVTGNLLILQKYKMNFDKNTGVIEMTMESLTTADEGTYTFQLRDGKATNQSSLVLIGDGTFTLQSFTCLTTRGR